RHVAAAAGRRAQRARHRPARHDCDPPGDQGGRRHPGRYRGDVMAPSGIMAAPAALNAAAHAAAQEPYPNARAAAQDFEAVFLNTMLSQMFTGIEGEGPFGGNGGAGVWRSFLTDEYAKSFARAGGIGIADQVYRSLIATQEAATTRGV